MHRRTILLGTAAALGGCAQNPEGSTANDTTDSGAEPSENGAGEEEYDDASFPPADVEAAFIDRYNEMRDERGLVTVVQDNILHEMGQAHAENMAEHDYIGHVQPDGTTIEDRYRQRGLLSGCELDVPGTNEYYPGAENAAGAAVGPVTHPGTDKTFYVRDPDSLAEFLMSSWMSSDGHREVMVLPSVREIGLGTAVRDDGEIFAALEFC